MAAIAAAEMPADEAPADEAPADAPAAHQASTGRHAAHTRPHATMTIESAMTMMRGMAAVPLADDFGF